MKRSNFSAARAHLERAMDHLAGNDIASVDARTALALLIDATILAEYAWPRSKVIDFVARTRRDA